MTMRFIDAVNNALNVHASWMSLPDGGTVKVLTDFGPEDAISEDYSLLRELRKMRDISRSAIIKEAQRRGSISEDYDAEADIAQLKKKEADFKDIHITVPGFFDPPAAFRSSVG